MNKKGRTSPAGRPACATAQGMPENGAGDAQADGKDGSLYRGVHRMYAAEAA